nr:ras-related protein Rab-15 isoform X2 [Dasypus novemcinctus]
MKTIEVDGIKVRIQIWDTAGQERYQTITKQYYRRAQGIFLVYDISSERSYQHIMKWVSDVDEYAPEGVQKILIGNKADEEQKRQVGREQGQQLAKEYGMDFYETSACTNLNIKEENCQNEEILNSLKYVRPGNDFQPTFTLVQKCEVNGQNEHPVFAYLKDKLPYPYDDPFSLMTDPKYIIWSPVRRSDVAWNFEKFLIGPEGEPFRRYSRTFPTINIEPDIKRLLKVAI